ncbi:hypothetical protein BD310DRAFT_261691 [Dichomitus squalens]|uniref:Uncharacterized protein n=1 Tax=Dichomitus squalens TaxID=114155 RepID=A0A4Q9PG58_9APHY|nr:hypothetical protein BD310DRAFT_261691 [Dichomitus squalens]
MAADVLTCRCSLINTSADQGNSTSLVLRVKSQSLMAAASSRLSRVYRLSLIKTVSTQFQRYSVLLILSKQNSNIDMVSAYMHVLRVPSQLCLMSNCKPVSLCWRLRV